MPLLKTIQDALAPVFRPAGNLIDGVNPGSWASAQNPIRPTLQLGTGIRQWDFTPGVNLQFTPRGDQAISFQQLWNVSNSFDLCRLMIEKRKNDISNRPWSIRVLSQPGETKSARLKREASNPNVGIVTKLLKYPDGVHRFELWVRMWIEQMLVFDAPTIFPQRAMDGSILSLRLISGATITPLLDQYGCRPAPPSPAYQQIILGIPTANIAGQQPKVTFTAPKRKDWQPGDPSELFYHPKNPRVDSRWGFSPVEQIIVTLSIAANRQQYLRDFYTSGNVPEGLLPMPDTWSAAQIKDFQKWFDSMLAGNLRMRRRMIMVPDAKREPTMTKTEALTDQTDDYLNRLVAFAFGESPQPLVKQVGHQSTAKEGNDQAQASGLEPDLAHVAGSLNDILLSAGYDDIEFVWEDPTEIDPVKKSGIDVAYVNAGIYTRNEVRSQNGDDPAPEPEADILCVTTATGISPLDAQAAADRTELLTPDPEPDDSGPGKPGGNSSKVRKAAPIKLVAGDLTPRSRMALQDAKRVLRKFLGNQKVRIAKGAAAALAARKVRKGDTQTDADRALAILAAIQWDYPTLYHELAPYLEVAAAEGAAAGAHQTAVNLGADMRDVLGPATKAATAGAQARAAELVGLKVEDDGTLSEATGAEWAMSTTAKDDVLNAIKQAIQENWTPAQLEAVIQASAVFTPDHGDMIADGEVTRQQALGHLTAWSQSGAVLEYAWTTAGDNGCCAVCLGFEALGSVPVGYQFAPMITSPGAHPFCRCWLTATKFAEE